MGRAEAVLGRGHVYDPLVDPRVRLVGAEVLRPSVLRTTWTDGAVRDLDLSSRMKGSAFRKMLAIPEVFRDFEIEEGGHGIRWINGIDFCADAMRIWADEQLAERKET